MENQRVTIPIKGVNRKLAGLGHCDEIINLRNNKGQWEVAGKKDVLHDLSEMIGDTLLTHWYRHPVTPDDWFICFQPSTGLLIKIRASVPFADTIHLFPAEEPVQKIYHFGYILIVTTDIDTYYFKFDNDEQEYTLLPKLEHGNIAISGTSVQSWARAIEEEISDPVSDTIKLVMSKLVMNINRLKNDGYINGHMFFRMAFKTTDGNYIKHTAPIYYFAGNNTNSYDGMTFEQLVDETPIIKLDTQDDATTQSSATAEFKYFERVRLKITLTSDQIDLIQKYKGLIKSLVLFGTNPKHDRDPYCEYAELIDLRAQSFIPSDQRWYLYPFSANLNEYFSHESLYYSIKEIYIEDIQEEMSFDISVEDITTKDILPVDNFTNHSLIPERILEYNSRLHYSNIKNYLFSGYDLFVNHNISSSKTFTAYVDGAVARDPVGVANDIYSIVRINLGYSIRTVIHKYDNVNLYNKGLGVSAILLNQIISYPDTRAESFQLAVLVGGVYKALTDEIPLIKHDFINIAYSATEYYQNPGFVIGGTTYYPGDRLYTYRVIDYVTTGVTLTPTEDRYYTDTNRVQVSALSSFLYFPAENSYRVGKLTNEIVSLMSQAQPLSEGQFGMFPLYVFTTNGIYALEQGEGDVLYKSIQPVGLDVAVGEAIPVLDGLVFPSQKGIMVLSGRRATCISEPLHETPLTEMVLDHYADLVNGTDDVIDTEALSLISFMDYIKDAIITYDYTQDEIIVSSTKKTDSVDLAYKYSYVYSIKQGMWYKTDEYYEELFGKYGYLQGVIYDLSTETQVLRPVLVKTRPFTFGNLVSFDRIAARLRALYSKTEYLPGAIGKCALYLYGSLDSGTGSGSYKPVSGIKIDAATAHKQEIMLRRSRTTARWFILVLAINSRNSVLDGFETDVMNKYNNRLR